MKAKASATAMSKHWLQEQGYIVGLTEQNVRIPKKQPDGSMLWEMFKRDLWTFADLTAINAQKQGTLYVQCTIGMNNKPERMAKILACEYTSTILKAGNQIELHIWRKLKGSGRIKWELARYTLKHLLPGDEKSNPMVWYDEQQAQMLEQFQLSICGQDDDDF